MIVVGDMPIDAALRKFRRMYMDKLLDYKKHQYYVGKSEKKRIKRQRAKERSINAALRYQPRDRKTR